MTCNLCKAQTKNPILNTMSLNAVMNMQGMRMISTDGGCTDFDAPKEPGIHQSSNQNPLHYIFAVDISSFANMNKSSLAIIEATQKCYRGNRLANSQVIKLLF